MLNKLGLDKVFHKGKINREEIEKNCSLGEVVFMHIDFQPWEKKVEAIYETVNAKCVQVCDDGRGVYVKINHKTYSGAYVDVVTCTVDGWCGIFNTKEDAEKCFLETMAKWKMNIPG